MSGVSTKKKSFTTSVKDVNTCGVQTKSTLGLVQTYLDLKSASCMHVHVLIHTLSGEDGLIIALALSYTIYQVLGRLPYRCTLISMSPYNVTVAVQPGSTTIVLCKVKYMYSVAQLIIGYAPHTNVPMFINDD